MLLDSDSLVIILRMGGGVEKSKGARARSEERRRKRWQGGLYSGREGVSQSGVSR
jgi:hypothetical protein